MKTPGTPHVSEPQKPHLDRKEWDFRPGPDHTKETKKGDWTAGIKFDFLPEDESYFCWQYEFSRYDTQASEFYLKWREGADKPKDFDSLLDLYWRTDPNGKTGCSLIAAWFYMIWPEWPERSYLFIPLKERKRRFKKTWEKEAKKPKKQLRLIHLRDIYRFVVAVKAEENPKSLVPGRNYETEMLDDTWVLTRFSTRDPQPPIEVAAFEIDFTMTDELLATRFQNWLAQRRKEKGYKRLDRRITRADRSDLISLGALRLMESGFSIKEAMNYSGQISGKALYEDASDWSHARKRAENAIYRAC